MRQKTETTYSTKPPRHFFLRLLLAAALLALLLSLPSEAGANKGSASLEEGTLTGLALDLPM